MIHKHKESGDWNNVRIIGLSIDYEKQKLIQHVTDKGWTDVEHYWVRNGKCMGDKDFRVQDVPHCVLVDTYGKIVWMGHPSERDLETDINALLAGKILNVKPEEEKGEVGASSKSGFVESEKAKDIVDAFIAETKLLLDDDLKLKALDL